MVNYLTEAELKFQYLFCHKMAPGAVEARGRLLAPQMDAAALGASLARPTGHSRGLGTATFIVGAPRWRISPPSEIQRFLIWTQSLMPNP